MKRLILLPVIIFLFTSLKGQEIETINFDQLKPRLSVSNDTVYLINFWATWCKPCTDEMPELVKLADELKDKNFKLLLVSLDLPSQVEARVKPFVKKLNINSEVVLLDDPDSNRWINAVNPTWSGGIPATLIISKDFGKFIEGRVTYDEVKRIVTPGIK